MFTAMFWRDAAERAVSTAAQAFVAYVGADMLNVLDFAWADAGAVAAGAAVLSVVKALAARGVGEREDASLVK